MWASRTDVKRSLELGFIGGVLSEPGDGSREFGSGNSSMSNAAISTTPMLS